MASETITLTKEEQRVLAQLCNAATDGSGYLYRGETMKRVAARIREKILALASHREEQTRD